MVCTISQNKGKKNVKLTLDYVGLDVFFLNGMERHSRINMELIQIILYRPSYMQIFIVHANLQENTNQNYSALKMYMSFFKLDITFNRA
jgi:hypothetical protein